jgi:lysophospholipase L1-like esterase
MRFILLASLLCTRPVWSDDPPRASDPARLPKVVLIGDSIRLGYAPVVIRELEGRAVVVHSKANGGDSANVLKHLQEWAIAEQPDVVHFNCGIHDIKRIKETGAFQISPEQYAANLRQIVEKLRRETKAQVIFATTTPIIDERAEILRTKANYQLLDASSVEYNRIAVELMRELEVPVDDLRAACGSAREQGRLLAQDGVHFTPEGRERLGKAVAACVQLHLPAQ